MKVWNKNKTIIGVELDSKEIRAVELSGTKKKPTIINWGKMELPVGIIKEGRVQNKESLSVSLKKFFNENGFKSKDVVLGVNNQDIIIRFALFPKVPNDKIDSMIKFQAQDHIPVPIKDIELDYIVLGNKNTENGEMINVVLVGARTKMLNNFIESFSKVRYTIQDIDSTMLALGRSALIESQDGNFVLASFNNDIGNILIFNNGILAVARSVTLTHLLESSDPTRVVNTSIKERMEKVAEILFTEIKSSVGYHKTQNNGSVDKILLIGNCAEQRIVADILRETTGLSVITPAPYASLHYKANQGDYNTFHAPDYVASISLAISGLGD